MIHLVFQQADVNIMQKAIELDKALAGDVIEIKDDYAVGPIVNIHSEEEAAARKHWWIMVLGGGDADGIVEKGDINDNKTVAELLHKLDNDPDEILWIWVAQNKHDVSGYYWLISQLKNYQERINVLHLNNLPFINDKGQLFYPTNLFEIAPKEFLKAKKLARPVTTSEFEIDPDEWKKLCDEEKGVRTLEGARKLIQHDYDYYDKELMKFITADWQKVNKLIHTFLSKSKNTTGDMYLLWRLKKMIEERKIEAQGEIKYMKDFEVKLNSDKNSATE